VAGKTNLQKLSQHIRENARLPQRPSVSSAPLYVLIRLRSSVLRITIPNQRRRLAVDEEASADVARPVKIIQAGQN
jgi:hypothetical protein